jgi:hypothetical protein
MTLADPDASERVQAAAAADDRPRRQMARTPNSAAAITTATDMIAAPEHHDPRRGGDQDGGGHDRCGNVGRGGMTVRPGGPSVSSFNGSPGPLGAVGEREATS